MANLLGLTRRGLVVLILIVIGLMVFFYQIGLLKPLISGITWLGAPFQKIAFQTSFKLNDFFSTITNISDMHRQNGELQDRFNRLLVENVRLKETARENELLREQLKFNKNKNFKLTPAFVIGYDPESRSQISLIDQGWDGGLAKGQPVIAADGLLVGQITAVEKSSAKVLLIVDNNSVVNVMDQESRAGGLLRGQHGLGLSIDTISRQEMVKSGDLVITSGLGGQFPRGLVVGEIQEVSLADNELFQNATVKPAIRFDGLELVFVIISFP